MNKNRNTLLFLQYLITILYIIVFTGVHYIIDVYPYESTQNIDLFLMWDIEKISRIIYVVLIVIFIITFVKIPRKSFCVEFFSLDFPVILALTFEWWNGMVYNLLHAITPYEKWKVLKFIFIDPYIVEALFLWSSLMIGMEIVRFIPVIKKKNTDTFQLECKHNFLKKAKK